jgi:hypothetical protein
VRLSRPAQDFAVQVTQYQRAVNPSRLDALALHLGLTVATLQRFGIGWSNWHRAWTFPMRHTDGKIIGIRLRLPSGRKLAVKGSKDGLFVPDSMDLDAPVQLLIAEGPTDAAALVDLGFPAVVGRPSCTGGIKLLAELVRRVQPREAVVMADGDEPGQRGADNLANVLLCYCPVVRVITPPAGIKDARAWLLAGAANVDLERAIAAAPARQLTVDRKAVRHGR